MKHLEFLRGFAVFEGKFHPSRGFGGIGENVDFERKMRFLSRNYVTENAKPADGDPGIFFSRKMRFLRGERQDTEIIFKINRFWRICRKRKLSQLLSRLEPPDFDTRS